STRFSLGRNRRSCDIYVRFLRFYGAFDKMINIVNGSVLSTNYSEELQDSSGLTIPNLTLSAGQRFYIVYHYRNADDIQISAPVWNGQTAEPLIPRHDGNGLFWVAPFVIVAQSSGTADLTTTVLGINNPQYTYLNSTS